MSRAPGTAHTGAVVRAGDVVAHWKCDEAAASDDFVDAAVGRNLSQINEPTVSPSLFKSSPTSGARTFNGLDEYAGRAAADGDEAVFQTLRFGFACWARVDAEGCIAEYGEFSNPETQATNVQFRFEVRAGGILRSFWENGAGVNVTVDTPAVFDGAGDGVDHHFGLACWPSPNFHDKAMLCFYVDSECVHIEDNVAPMDGGSSARWILGASRAGGSGVGTPGLYFGGTLDDVIVAAWSPQHEWFRTLYQDGVRDFHMKCGDEGFASTDAYVQEVYARVLVEVGTSEFTALDDIKVNKTDLDLTNIYEIDFLRSVEWGESVDDAGASATIELWARFGFFNLSPYVGGGPLAGLWSKPRRIKIEVAMVPVGTTREGVGPHWWLMFDGFTLSPDISGDVLTMTCIDRIGALQDVWVEPAKAGADRTYGSGAGIAVETEAQKVIDDNDPARYEIIAIDDTGGGGKLSIQVHGRTTPNGQGKPHLLTTGDAMKISGTTSFNSTRTVDAATTETHLISQEVGPAGAAEATGIVTAVPALSYLGGKPTIWVETSPSFNLFERNEPPTKNVAQLIADWFDWIGWRLKYVYDALRSEYRLKAFDPRASPTTITRSSDNVYPFRRLAQDRTLQRNVGEVEFADEASKDPLGERQRGLASATAVTHRSGGRRFFRLAVGPESLITNTTEADKLVDTMVDDMKAAESEGDLPMPFDPQVEVHDGVTLGAETAAPHNQMPQAIDGAIVGAVSEVRHRIAATEARTTIRKRKIASGVSLSTSIARVEKHVDMLNRSSLKGRALSGPTTPGAPTVTNLGAVNGNRLILVTWTPPAADRNRAWTMTEVHVSTSTGFTPSSSTRKQLFGADGGVVLHGVGAGVTGYVKIVHRDRMGNRSAASAQTSFVS